MTPIIYHNPRCSKSRAAVEYLENSKKTFVIREYLKDPLTEGELKELVENITPLHSLVRKSEESKEFFSKKTYTKENVLTYLSYNQKDLERPIVKTQKGLAIGRPLENIYPLF